MKKGDLYREDYKNGLKVGEIAIKYGVSKQAVSQCCCVYGKHKFKPIPKEKCIYMHLREWMNVNKVKRSGLMHMVGLEPLHNNYKKFNSYLTGNTEPKKSLIDKLIKVTGLPYAMLFWEG